MFSVEQKLKYNNVNVKMKEGEIHDGGKYKDDGDQTVPVRNEEDPLPYVARKSKRVIKNVAGSDGDIWREHLIVIQVPVESRRKKACKAYRLRIIVKCSMY